MTKTSHKPFPLIHSHSLLPVWLYTTCMGHFIKTQGFSHDLRTDKIHLYPDLWPTPFFWSCWTFRTTTSTCPLYPSQTSHTHHFQHRSHYHSPRSTYVFLACDIFVHPSCPSQKPRYPYTSALFLTCIYKFS